MRVYCITISSCFWARRKQIIEQNSEDREKPQGDENGGRHDCQTSDVVSSRESETLVMAMIIDKVISDRVVELNSTTVDSRTDEAEVGGVSDLNASKWKCTHLENSDGHTSFFGIRQRIPFTRPTIITAKRLRNK